MKDVIDLIHPKVPSSIRPSHCTQSASSTNTPICSRFKPPQDSELIWVVASTEAGATKTRWTCITAQEAPELLITQWKKDNQDNMEAQRGGPPDTGAERNKGLNFGRENILLQAQESPPGAALPLFIPAEETKLNSVPRAREVRSIRPSADLRCNHETHRSTA
ncbi:unnamed protein product [Pleuronectes platessa]|uniref:Uncharacterized protein n=1 Tax=Pleuronectes platessa TaxID=8262 RepID=A0A9N7UG10_PLEPL|nr:unnamed protein product [Pleuronectes platessa]